MLRLNKSTRYGLYAMMALAQSDGAPVAAGQIAERFRVSVHHLAKVLQQLVRAGLVFSVRGAGGGHRLARPARDITLYDIIVVFEGERRIGGCLLADEADGECLTRNACGLGDVLDEIDQQIAVTLQSITLKTLVTRRPHTSPSAGD